MSVQTLVTNKKSRAKRKNLSLFKQTVKTSDVFNSYNIFNKLGMEGRKKRSLRLRYYRIELIATQPRVHSNFPCFLLWKIIFFNSFQLYFKN